MSSSVKRLLVRQRLKFTVIPLSVTLVCVCVTLLIGQHSQSLHLRAWRSVLPLSEDRLDLHQHLSELISVL